MSAATLLGVPSDPYMNMEPTIHDAPRAARLLCLLLSEDAEDAIDPKVHAEEIRWLAGEVLHLTIETRRLWAAAHAAGSAGAGA